MFENIICLFTCTGWAIYTSSTVGKEIDSALPIIKNNVIVGNELGVLMHSGNPLLDYITGYGEISVPRNDPMGIIAA